MVEVKYIAPEDLRVWHLRVVRETWTTQESAWFWYKYYYDFLSFNPSVFATARLQSANDAILKERLVPTFKHDEKLYKDKPWT